MKDMFSIGELARYQNISKQTLIFYDKIGLFRPAYVDPDNKYRYYKASQIDYLDTILIMKEMGFSLGEIQEHMKTYTINTSLIALRKQLTVLDQQIKHLQLVRNRLAHRCEQMETVKEVCENNPLGYASMYQDYMNHRKTEIDRINGAIAELADEYGIVAPCNKMLIRLVHAMEG